MQESGSNANLTLFPSLELRPSHPSAYSSSGTSSHFRGSGPFMAPGWKFGLVPPAFVKTPRRTILGWCPQTYHRVWGDQIDCLGIK